MDSYKLRTVKFELEDYGIGQGMKRPPHPALRDFTSFKLSVENCRITEVRVLYSIIEKQLKVEAERIETTKKEGKEVVHPLQYGVVEFLQNILTEMQKAHKDIDDLAYYVIKAQ